MPLRSMWILKSTKTIHGNTALTHLPSHMESFEWGPLQECLQLFQDVV